MKKATKKKPDSRRMAYYPALENNAGSYMPPAFFAWAWLSGERLASGIL